MRLIEEAGIAIMLVTSLAVELWFVGRAVSIEIVKSLGW
jgi:hypothetical protein